MANREAISRRRSSASKSLRFSATCICDDVSRDLDMGVAFQVASTPSLSKHLSNDLDVLFGNQPAAADNRAFAIRDLASIEQVANVARRAVESPGEVRYGKEL